MFEESGYGHVFHIRGHLLNTLEWSCQPKMHDSLPTLEGFQSIFPRGKFIDFMLLFKGLLPVKVKEPVLRKKETVPKKVEEPQDESWAARLRPRQDGRAMSARTRSIATPKTLSRQNSQSSIERRMGNSCESDRPRPTLTAVGVSLKRSRSNL